MSKIVKKKHREINAISPTANLILSACMIVVALIFIMPLILVISTSFTKEDALIEYGYSFWPRDFSIFAYTYVFKLGDGMWRAYANTIFYSVVGTVVSLIIMSMFAYVLSRKDFGARNKFAFYAFFTTLFHGGLVPTYMLYVRYLKIDNTIWVFLLPGLVTAFNTIILRTFINSTIHDSLIESAKLDGASDFQTYLRIVMPLFKAGLASVGLFTFVGKWNDWFVGLTYIRDPKLIPIMTYLHRIQAQVEFLKSGAPESMTPDALELLNQLPKAGVRMSITVIAIFPLLICYPFFQKYFIKGLTVGGVKG